MRLGAIVPESSVMVISTYVPPRARTRETGSGVVSNISHPFAAKITLFYLCKFHLRLCVPLFKAITELFTRSWVHQLAINHLTQSQTNLHIHPSSGPCDFCDVGYILYPLGTCVFSETEAAYHGLAIRMRRTEMSSAQGNTVGAY